MYFVDINSLFVQSVYICSKIDLSRTFATLINRSSCLLFFGLLSVSILHLSTSARYSDGSLLVILPIVFSSDPVGFVGRAETFTVCLQERERDSDFLLTISTSDHDARFASLCASNTCPINVSEVALLLFNLHGSTPNGGVAPFPLPPELVMRLPEFLLEGCDFGS